MAKIKKILIILDDTLIILFRILSPNSFAFALTADTASAHAHGREAASVSALRLSKRAS